MINNFRVEKTSFRELRIDTNSPHQENNVQLVLNEFTVINGGGRVEDEPGLAPSVLDELKRPVNVVRGLGVERNVRGSGIDEVLDGSIDGRNHEVDIDRGRDTVVAKGLADLENSM